MSIVDDVMYVRIISELDGVQMHNHQYFEIDALGDDPSDVSMLNDIVNDYHDRIKVLCGADWKIVCATIENMTTPAGKATIFVTLIGTGAGDTHPQHQVIRFNIYAKEQPVVIMHHGAWNQSGIIKTKSLRGRYGNPDDFIPFNTWLSNPGNYGGTGWAVSTLLQYDATPPPAPFFTAAYANINKVDANLQFLTLKSRKTKLCAVQ